MKYFFIYFLPSHVANTALTFLLRNKMTFHPFFTLLFINCWWLCVSGAGTDAVWNEWAEWTSCSVSCGEGVQKRFRTCTPPTRPGGKWCEGKYVETRECDTGARCPVNGGWSSWSQWGRCTVSCGQGTMERYRSCSNPFPEEGGRKCIGNPSQSQSCTAIKECPRDGGWSDWSQWSKCSVTCGTGGSINRYRSCNNPPPKGEGRPCEGPKQESRTCQAPTACPVNGQWSEWTDWTPCSVTCGTGSRSRQRACDHPPPLHGGDDCDRTHAAELQTTSCTPDIVHCPLHGGWSGWSDWKECRSADCGSSAAASRSFRHRSCNSPLPAHNGSMCDGPFVNAGLCAQALNCKVDGEWGEWSEWNCKGSSLVAVRLRTCDSPAPANGGKRCRGMEKQFLPREEDPEAYFQACPRTPSDDEDLGEGSGNQEASGFGSSFDED